MRTINDFNEKYKDHIINGYDGLNWGNRQVIEYLDKLFTNLIKIPYFKFFYIKRNKQGELEFKTNFLSTDRIKEILKEIEEVYEKSIRKLKK